MQTARDAAAYLYGTARLERAERRLCADLAAPRCACAVCLRLAGVLDAPAAEIAATAGACACAVCRLLWMGAIAYEVLEDLRAGKPL